MIDLPSIIDGEDHENRVRKNFTHSERVAIARAIEDRIGNRQGERTDNPELRKNFSEVEPGQRTSEVVAKKAGYGNRVTYEQAEKVVRAAVPELCDALDRGDMSVAAAFAASKEEPAVQRRIATAPSEDRKQMLRDIRLPKNRPKTDQAETLNKQGVLMAIEDITNAEVTASRMAVLAHEAEREDLSHQIPAALAYLTDLKKELNLDQA